MKLLYFTLVSMTLIFMACDPDVNNDEYSEEPMELVSETSPTENTETQTENIDQVTFNQIINNPFQFEDKDEKVYSFFLTNNLSYTVSSTRKPKVGEVEVLQIDGDSPDFGPVLLRIVLDDFICAQGIIDKVSAGTDYSCFIRIYRIFKRISPNTPAIYVWADLLEKPEILIL